jgi:hypothetical protein
MPTVTPAPVAVALGVPAPTASAPTTHRVAARALYTYYSAGVGPGDGNPPGPDDVDGRTLYTYYSAGVAGHPAGGELLSADDVLARALYLYYSLGHGQDPTDVDLRALYTYEAYDNTELFPWIEKIAPTEQVPGGTIAIYGDGFGATEGAEGGIVRLGTPVDPTAPGPGTALGVVAWQTRSPGLYPANSGTPTEPAITATIPDEATSGMISVEETT